MHNIRRHLLPVDRRVEGRLVSIKLVHGREVGGTDTDDDDGEGQLGTTHDLVDSLLEVTDDTIGDDQKNVVLLRLLRAAHLLSHIIDKADNWRKVGRSV